MTGTVTRAGRLGVFTALAVVMSLSTVPVGGAGPAVAQSDDQNALDPRSLHSVVLIHDKGNPNSNWGTGLIVGAGPGSRGGEAMLTVLTASHVVGNVRSATVSLRHKPYLFYPLDAIESLGDGLDISVLSLAIPSEELRAADLASIPLALPTRAGDTVRPIGHTPGQRWISGLLVPVSRSDRTATHSRLTIARGASRDRLCTTSFDPAQPCIVEGFSGGPVFDRTGAWAGVTVEVVGQDALVVSAVDVFARLTARRNPELLQSYERQLLLAAAAQHADRIQALCAAGARMVSVGDAGSALHVAAWKGDPAAVRALRKCANFDVEIRSSDASTPLMLAARYGHKDLLDLLLSWRADARAKTASGSTALHQAAEGTGNEAARPAIVRTLVQSGADPNAPSDGGWTPLLSAISAERHGPARTGIVKELLDVGADPNRHATLGSGTVMIPLHLAVEDGVSATVEALLAKHALVDALDTQGRTALMKLASDRGMVSAMQTREGDFSCWNDDDDLTLKARVLLKYRADTSLRDREHGKTALELGKSRHVSTPGDKRCRDCMIAALRGGRCRDTWED